MIKRNIISIISLIILIFVSCSQSSKKQGAIIFSFDDQSIDEWINTQYLFERYNIKATFFICRPHLLDSIQIEGLKKLSKYGHEIACHSLNHQDVTNYLDSFDVYINKEIIPAKEYLQQMGFTINSFAYTYGSSNNLTDSVLLNYFSYIRKATYNENNSTIDKYDDIFMGKNKYKVINAMGIDNNYKITLENIKTGLLRAKQNNEILVLYAHRIVEIDGDYRIKPSYLEEVFKLCKQYDIESITFNKVESFFGD